MRRRTHRVKPDRLESIGPATINHSDMFDPRLGHASQHRPDHRRRIKRFFRLQSFPEKATKKTPRDKD
jgi:hypothetical protein